MRATSLSSLVFDDKYRIFLGSHRIQRVPKSEKNGRRHTSYVIVSEIKDIKTETVLDDKDIRIDYYRASGAGGQHRNKTESAVRMTHVPTGLVVTASEQRSQHQNRAVARSRLLEKLNRHSGPDQLIEGSEAAWNWCDWRDEVVLPSGKRYSMKNILKKGI